MSMIERIESALRERRILTLGRAAIACQRKGDRLGARVYYQRMAREIEARTPQQVGRMERARRLEARQIG